MSESLGDFFVFHYQILQSF